MRVFIHIPSLSRGPEHANFSINIFEKHNKNIKGTMMTVMILIIIIIINSLFPEDIRWLF